MVEPQLQERIQALDDAAALSVLRVLAEHHQGRVDVRSARLVEERIGEALRQDDVHACLGPTSPRSVEGAIARLALINLADQGPEMATEVEQTIGRGIETDSRLEPVTLGLLGAAVLYAFSPEIKLEHVPGADGRFAFSTDP